MKKYEFTGETKVIFGTTLHQIIAVRDFSDVASGEIGGWIEKEENLSHDGNAWVYGNAQVYGNACVYGNAWVSGNARVYGDARVSGDAWVYGNARVYGAGLALWIGGIGSRNGTTTFFACEDKTIKVVCGCFFGTIDEFSAAVEKTHGDNEHGRVYRLAIEMAKARILPNMHAAGEMEQAVQK